MAFIYKITNLITNKVYIGETNRTISIRWKQHKSRAKDPAYTEYLYLSMRKHGIENFIIEEIEQCLPEERFNRETFYILQYNSLAPNGYNLVLSQNGPTPEMMNIALSYWNDGLSIIGISNKLHMNVKTISVYLKTLGITQEEIFARRVKNIGMYSSKEVNQYNLQGELINEWPSASEAAKKLSLNVASITKSCTGNLLTYNDCIWQYKNSDNIEEIILEVSTKKKIGKNKKTVIQLNSNKEIVQTFESASAAGRHFNKAHTAIANAARNGTMAYGYYWKYEGENK